MGFRGWMVAIGTAALLAGCERGTAEAPAETPIPEVAIQVVQPQRVSFTTELPGRTSALLVSEVRPQVGGIILKREFVEGSDVEAGQVLYRIDPATYQAALDSARASLAKAEADVTSLKARAERYRKLVVANAVSKQEYDDALSSYNAAVANIALNTAEVKSAEINLEYTRITAPISGRIGKSIVTPGALVTAGQGTPLATIQELDRIYVDVTQSSAEYLRLKRDLAEGRIRKDGAGQAKVTLLLEDSSAYPHEGALQFSDVTVDQTTGSITLRAIVPNPDHDLLPGMYVRAVLEEGVNEKAILAPQRAVTRTPRGDATALVVGADSKVEERQLVADRIIGSNWLITSGLNPGDRLIIDGLQRVRPGATVKPLVQQQAADAGALQSGDR
jgi:membrane fusion protein, multidrug efflux system